MPVVHPSEKRSACDLELIRCPYQPGNLRITRHACALRYLCSKRMDSVFPKSDFEMAHKSGLEICKSCRKGRLYAKGGTP